MTRKTYTGPTLGGGRMTVECPEWCVSDHEYWGETADDLMHCSEPAELLPPRDRAGHPQASRWPLLAVELRQHSTDPGPSAASVWILPQDGRTENAVEMNLAGVEQLLARLDAFRAEVAQAGNLLASIEASRRAEAR